MSCYTAATPSIPTSRITGFGDFADKQATNANRTEQTKSFTLGPTYISIVVPFWGYLNVEMVHPKKGTKRKTVGRPQTLNPKPKKGTTMEMIV